MSQKLQSQIQGKFQPRRPQSKKEEQEFGPGKKDIVICPQCQAFYYYKSWHHHLEEYRHLSEDKRVKFQLCPACQMIKEGKYEGQVILKNVPLEKEEEMIKLVKNFGEEAFRRDPLDRIIKIKSKKISQNLVEIEILTTENQLAVRIGKKIKGAFKGDLEIKYSHQEDTARVIWRSTSQ